MTHKDMLQAKYQELRNLLYDQYKQNGFKLDPQLIGQAKELLKRFQSFHEGNLKEKDLFHNAKKRRPPSAASTQTGPPPSNDYYKSYEEPGMVFYISWLYWVTL